MRELEEEHYQTEQKLESCAKEEEEALLDQFAQEQEMIEAQRKKFDDLEFNQLEVRMKFILLYDDCLSHELHA